MLTVGMSLSSCSSDDNDNSSSLLQGTANSDQTALSKGAWDFYAVSEGDTIYFKIDKSTAGTCYVVAKQFDVKNPKTGEITSLYTYDDYLDLLNEYNDFYGEQYGYNGDDVSYSYYPGDITIPASVTVNGTTYTVKGIGDYAFYNTKVTSLKMPSTIRWIGKSAICWCQDLTSVQLSENLTEIGEWALLGDSLLTEITLPSKVSTIGRFAFSYNYGLKKLNIPASVSYIGYGAFYKNENLTTIDVDADNKYYQLKDGILYNKAGDILHTYFNFNKASSFTVAENIDSICGYAFGGCQNLKSVTVSGNVTSLPEGVFFECENLEQVKLPKTLKYIGDCTFLSCESLKDIVLPDAVKYIGESAFLMTGLEEINIPAGVTYIDTAAFSLCKSLKTVKSYITKPFEIVDYAFENYNTATLYVPSGTKALYEATAGWNEFKNIVEME